MYPFRKLIYSLRNENTIVLTRFCFEGYWDITDPIERNGGNVMYIDQYGIVQTLFGIYSGYETSIMAVSIISTVGVTSVVCDSGIPAPSYYTYDLSTTASNNTLTACFLSIDFSLYTAQVPFIVGVRFFSDVTLLFPFNGNGLYRSLKLGGSIKKVKISTSGYILEISNC